MTEQAGPTKRQPREIWAEMKATEYSPKAIKNVISFESDDALADIANQLKAANMIAYNRMVDSRIAHAQQSWGMK
jgi:hypothetical protein